jgi:hypothetical protein
MNIITHFPAVFIANSIRLLRWAIGINYLWFGALKFFSGLSPAEALAKDTVRIITFGMIPDDVNYIVKNLVFLAALGVILKEEEIM